LRILLAIFFLGVVLTLPAQKKGQQKIDSLKSCLLTEKNDTAYTNLLMTIGISYGVRNLDSFARYSHLAKAKAYEVQRSGKKEYRKRSIESVVSAMISIAAIDNENSVKNGVRDSLTKAIRLAESVGFSFGRGVAYITIGSTYSSEGNLMLAEQNILEGIKVLENTPYTKPLAQAYNNIGMIYVEKTEFKKAAEYYFKALKTKEEMKEKMGMYSTYQNLALMYEKAKDSLNQQKYMHKGMALVNEIGDQRLMGNVYNGMGISFINKNADSAFFYLYRSLRHRYASKDIQGESSTCYNIGEVYNQTYTNDKEKGSGQKNYLDSSLKYFNRSLKIRREINDMRGISQSLGGLGRNSVNFERYGEAVKYFKEGLEISQKTGHKERQLICLHGLNDAYSKWKKLDLAYPYYKHYIELRDSIENLKDQKAIFQKSVEFDYEKKNLADSLKNEEKLKVEELEYTRKEEKQNIITRVIIGFLLLMTIVSFIIYRSFRKNKKMNKILSNQNDLINDQNDQLAEKHKEITASIKYAKRIQTAQMASDKYVERNIERLKKK
jgi:tetratricopeptide (TPR) repeat protein